MSTICIFDDVASGHHPRYVAGIVHEAAIRGNRCTVACPHLSPELAGRSEIAWQRVAAGTLRRPIGGRRTLKAVVDAWSDTAHDAFWDLYLDKNAWVLPRALRVVPTRVHVLHAINQYQTEDRDALGRARAGILQSRIKRVVRNGGVIVVHTRKAFEVLASFLPADRLLLLGYPVETPDPIPRGNNSGRPRVLFVGGARREKGLLELLDALELLDRPVTLEIVGPQPAGLAGQVAEQRPALDIRWTNRFVTDDELREAFHRCDLVAAPYLPGFETRGGASGVLLQTLGEGVPLLTTPSLANQLPDGYGGAVVAESHDPGALADSITTGVNNLSRLATSASTDGPAFTRSFHSYGNYVEALLRVGQSGPITA